MNKKYLTLNDELILLAILKLKEKADNNTISYPALLKKLDDLKGKNSSQYSMLSIHLTEPILIWKTIDEIEIKLGQPTKFILPGGTIASSFLHLSRSITRRAERSLVKVRHELNLNPEMLRYVNRLSDLMFVLARESNNELNVKEQQPIYKYFDDVEEKNV